MKKLAIILSVLFAVACSDYQITTKEFHHIEHWVSGFNGTKYDRWFAKDGSWYYAADCTYESTNPPGGPGFITCPHWHGEKEQVK